MVNGFLTKETLSNGVVQTQHISRSKVKHDPSSNVDISQEVMKAVQSLKVDIERLNGKITTLESRAKTAPASSLALGGNKSLFGISPQLLAFIILWPFVAQFVFNRFLVRK